MISNLKGYTLTQDEELAEIVVINSCTVTNKADREVRSYARKQASLGKKVFFTGCGVKHLGRDLFKQNLIFGLFSHSHKEQVNHFLSSSSPVYLPMERQSKHVDSTILSGISGRVRAFIKVQEGCNFACSYCIIPSVRGPARSFSHDQIVKQVELLARGGVGEVILTGTNLGSYGQDSSTNLARLIEALCEIKGLRRLRLGSLEPSQIDNDFLWALESPKLERHLHIALQHTSQEMLEIMNRKNRFESDLELFSQLASRGFSLGTDYIVGHPGESERLFQEAIENLEKLPITHIHPFVYSPRRGTASAKMQDLESINGALAKQRLKLVKDLVAKKSLEFRLSGRGEILEVLIDGTRPYANASSEALSGLDQYFNRILIPPHLLKEGMGRGAWLRVSGYTPDLALNVATAID